MSDPLQIWLASQRELVERWLVMPHASASDAGVGNDQATAALQNEMQRWWQAVVQDASPQAQALAQQLLTLGPAFLAGTGDALFDLFGASANKSSEKSQGESTDKSGDTVFGRWADLAPIGYFREHQAHAQALAHALDDYRRIATQMANALSRIHATALELLAAKTQTLAAAGDVVADTRRLYNLWVECGERAFAEQARDETFGRMQGELVNAGVRVRIAQQTITEHFLKSLDLPTRAELNSVHQRLKAMRERIDRLEASSQQTLPQTSQTPKSPARNGKKK